MTKKYSIVFLLLLTLTVSSHLSAYGQSPKKEFIVVLDAGHGGRDKGNLGTGTLKKYEKDVSLDVVLMLGNYIKKNIPGVRVIYTRSKDVFLELHERTAVANKVNADLFISVHCNSAGKNRAPKGAETYVMGLSKNKTNLEVAKRENEVILLEDNHLENYEGFDPSKPESLIGITLTQHNFLEQSIIFSSAVQKQFKNRVGRRDRGVKQAPFYVVSYNSMPSVLIELGFLTNVEEERFLHSKQGKEYMASAIYRAFKEYKKEFDNIQNDRERTLEELAAVQDKISEAEGENVPSVEAKENQGIRFKVQLAASKTKLSTRHSIYKKYPEVEVYREKGYYKYCVGSEKQISGAKNLQGKVRGNGFGQAFVVAFDGEQKISVKEALRKLK